MSNLILHHYDFSNFSEKVRLVLGLKHLSWSSVTIPAYEPKPDYTPLTAGYRRTPALQIGADIYCDTRLIIEELERRYPASSIYPDTSAATRAHCDALICWAEQSLMRPLALYITGTRADEFPDAFHADRARLHGKPQPSVAQVKASAAKYQAQTEIQLQWLDALLSHGGDYVLPQGISVADFALYEAPWFLRVITGQHTIYPELARVQSWAARIEAVGHGMATEIDAEGAIAEARDADPAAVMRGVEANPEGLKPGEPVTITPFDQHSPAIGELVSINGEQITIASTHPRTSRIHVHFPRFGYRVGRARH